MADLRDKLTEQGGFNRSGFAGLGTGIAAVIGGLTRVLEVPRLRRRSGNSSPWVTNCIERR
jgi:hypothetical protein